MLEVHPTPLREQEHSSSAQGYYLARGGQAWGPGTASTRAASFLGTLPPQPNDQRWLQMGKDGS